MFLIVSVVFFFLLQCDGQYIPLPSLQGIAVLNIPSYAGGTNFWGGTKEDDVSSVDQRKSGTVLFYFLVLCHLGSDHTFPHSFLAVRPEIYQTFQLLVLF